MPNNLNLQRSPKHNLLIHHRLRSFSSPGDQPLQLRISPHRTLDHALANTTQPTLLNPVARSLDLEGIPDILNGLKQLFLEDSIMPG